MTQIQLPFRATVAETCAWLTESLGYAWGLPDLLEHGLTPFVWLDYCADYPELFGDATGGYPAPIFFEGDIAHLAAGSPDVLITITKDADKIVTRLPDPGMRFELSELRFLKKEIQGLAGKIQKAALTKANPPPVANLKSEAQESKTGINLQQVLTAFRPLVKFDLEQALNQAQGVFSDEGARIKSTTKKAKSKILWNPVTLALGLNDTYRVPVSQLKKAFITQDFLYEWRADWEHSLLLLGL